MGREKKKGERGEATTYYSRTQAMRKLQISMPEFRRLCILKGIHPQEPKHKRKVNKGSSVYKTYYYRKDIQWLAHEPLLKNGREFKIFLKKLKKALDKEDAVKTASLEEHRPRYTLDHIVKERYPSFVDALRDIDDALTLIFLYASIASKKVKSVVVHNCKRLAMEFMHYIISSRSLRKVFLSIKGIYYQVEIEGQTISWLTPYQFPQRIPRDVDFRVMGTFVEFYSTLLGFINYRLYHSLNLRYPPQISGLSIPPESTDTPSLLVDPNDLEWDRSEHRDLLESLSHSLVRVMDSSAEIEVEDEDIPVDLDPEEQEQRDQAKKQQEELERFKHLFEGCRFFISRETPRESLTFVIRSFGGEVSWDCTTSVGATYGESDETITHQIMDRPEQKHSFLTRVYVQPQWVYDSVNFHRLLPHGNYAPGAVLPPHLSPFVSEKEGDYVTPDKAAILEAFGEEEEKEDLESTSVLLEEKTPEEDIQIMDEDEEDIAPPLKKRKTEDIKIPVGTVTPGGGENEADAQLTSAEVEAKEQREEKKLAVMMMTRKRKKLYDRIMRVKNKKAARVKVLQQRRRAYEARLRTS